MEFSASLSWSVGIESEWTQTDMSIPKGVVCFERDTGRLKLGDGVSLYPDLPYIVEEDISPELRAQLDILVATQSTLIGLDGKIDPSYLPDAVKNDFSFVQTIAQRDALPLNRRMGIVVVVDATGDSSVKSGGATYLWNTDSSTWTKVSETESMDIDSDEFLLMSKRTLDDVRDGTSFLRMSQDDVDALDDLSDMAVVQSKLYHITAVSTAILTERDPDWNKVSMLLKFDSGISDLKSTPIVTYNSAPIVDADTPFSSGKSLSFNGTNQALRFTNTSAWYIKALDFTFEGWFKIPVYKTVDYIMSMTTPSDNKSFTWYIDPTGHLIFSITKTSTSAAAGDSVAVISSQQVPLNVWQHLAISRIGGRLMSFVPGKKNEVAIPAAHAAYQGTAPVYMGYVSQYSSAGYFSGKMDDVRVTLGKGRYSEDFVPVPVPFPVMGP